MATIQILYRCGCGFSTKEVIEAVVHSEQAHHSLDVIGRIIKDKEVSRVNPDSTQVKQ